MAFLNGHAVYMRDEIIGFLKLWFMISESKVVDHQITELLVLEIIQLQSTPRSKERGQVIRERIVGAGRIALFLLQPFL